MATAKLVAEAPRWVGWMPQTVSAWSNVVLPISMTASALAAWLVRPFRSTQMTEQLAASPRSRGAAVVHAAAVPSLVAAAAATASLLIAGGWTVVLGGHAWVAAPHVLIWYLGTIASSVAFAILGGVIAWIVKGIIAVAVAPAVVYCLTIAPMYTLDPPPWSGLYAAVGFPWIGATPSLLSAGCRAALWLGIAALFAAVLTQQKRMRAAAVVVIGVAVVVGVIEGPRTSQIPEAHTVVCQDGHPTVCTSGPFAAGLPVFARYVRAGYAALPPALRPDRVGTNRTAAGAEGVVFAPEGGVASPTNLPNHDATLSAMGKLIFMSNCHDATAAADQSALLLWWRMEFDIPVGQAVRPGDVVLSNALPAATYRRSLAAARRLSQMPEEQRMAWFTSHAAAIASCRLDSADLP